MKIYIFLLSDSSFQHYPANNGSFSQASILFPELQLGSSQVSNFNHMYFKKSKDPYLALQSHIFKSCVCASDLKIIETRGFEKPNFSYKMFQLQLIPKTLKATEWKREQKPHTACSQSPDRSAEMSSKCAPQPWDRMGSL